MGLASKISSASFASASCICAAVDDETLLQETDNLPINSMHTHLLNFLRNKGVSVADNLFDEFDHYMEKRRIQPDLTRVYGILASTVWNKNDDIFTPQDTWPAIDTCWYKPANLDHLGREIVGENFTIGCICDAWPVDENRKRVYADIDAQDNLIVPSFFDIVVGINIWSTYFPSAATAIADGIKNRDIFISMECMFKDFGYALRSKDSEETLLLPRNDVTSWMSQHLRILGGNGKVDIDGVEYQIGRWLRNFVFTGVGFVHRPANERSILFEDIITAQFREVPDPEGANWEFRGENLPTKSKSCVLNNSEGKILWLM